MTVNKEAQRAAFETHWASLPSDHVDDRESPTISDAEATRWGKEVAFSAWQAAIEFQALLLKRAKAALLDLGACRDSECLSPNCSHIIKAITDAGY